MLFNALLLARNVYRIYGYCDLIWLVYVHRYDSVPGLLAACCNVKRKEGQRL